jgi:hypothetical protein
LEKMKIFGARVVLLDLERPFLVIFLLIKLVGAESVVQIVVAVLEVFEITAVPGAVALTLHAMLAKRRRCWMMTWIVGAAEEVGEGSVVPEEARIDCPEQSTNGQAVLEVMLVFITAKSTTDEEVSMCHVVDQGSQNNFRSLVENDLWIKQYSDPTIWVSCPTSGAMYGGR